MEVALRGRTDFCQSTGAGDEHGNSAPGCAAVGKEGWRCFFCSHGKRKTDTLRQHRENAIDAKAKIIVPVTAALRTVDVINVIKRDIYRRHAGPAAMFPLSCAHAQSRTALAPSLRTANLGSALKKKKIQLNCPSPYVFSSISDHNTHNTELGPFVCAPVVLTEACPSDFNFLFSTRDGKRGGGTASISENMLD